MSDYKISEIRFAAHKKAKYLSQITFGLIPVSTPGIGTMAVDCYGRLYYDPAFLHEDQSLEELAGVFVHECMHVVLNHAKRRRMTLGEYADPEMLFDWNVATDAAINDTLRKGGISLVDGCVYPELFDLPGNKTAEWYYEQIRKQKEEQEEQPGGGGGSGGGEGDEPSPTERPQDQKAGKGPGQGAGDAEPEDDDTSEGQGGYDGPPVDRTKGGGGSASDGEPREWELGEPDEETPGISEYKIDSLRRQAVQEMKESISRGNLSGDMQAVIDLILEPKIDPLAELRAMVKYAVNSTHGFGEHTYKKRNPRQPRGMLRIPAHRQPRPEVRIIVDTSGSMKKNDLALALGVVQKAVRHLQSGVEVISADVDIRACKKVFRADQVELIGRGGTDMACAMEHAMEQTPKPNVLVVVTDGETPWPMKEIHAKCVAAITRDGAYYSTPPDWIKVVKLEVPDE